MTTYKLLIDKVTNLESPYALEIVDGVITGNFVHKETNQAYLAWVALGNQPTPADEVTK
jgi:hypothetical protein